jgi:hypothetical protein
VPPRTSFYVLAFLALGFADGVVAYSLYPGQFLAPSSWAISIAALFLLFAWYRFDSDSRNYKRTPLLSIGVVALTLFVFPYYLFRTRGFRRGSLATLIFLLIGIGYSVSGYLGQLVARALRT